MMVVVMMVIKRRIPCAASLHHNSGCRNSTLSTGSTLGRGPPQQENHDVIDEADDDGEHDGDEADTPHEVESMMLRWMITVNDYFDLDVPQPRSPLLTSRDRWQAGPDKASVAEIDC